MGGTFILVYLDSDQRRSGPRHSTRMPQRGRRRTRQAQTLTCGSSQSIQARQSSSGSGAARAPAQTRSSSSSSPSRRWAASEGGSGEPTPAEVADACRRANPIRCNTESSVRDNRVPSGIRGPFFAELR